MKAVGDWVVLKTEEEVSGSGIVSINDNICLVVDCNYETSIIGKRAIYNASGNHFTYNEYIIVQWKDIMAVVE